MAARARRDAAKTRRPRAPELAVEAVVESRIDPERLTDLIADLPVAGMLRLEAPSVQRMTVVVTPLTWRIDLRRGSMYGGRMSLVRHRDGRAVWLDHGSKSRLELPPDSVPNARALWSGHWQVAEGDTRVESRRAELEVTLDDPASGTRWLQRIRCGPPYDQPDLARSFFEALVGGAGIHTTTGYPVEEVADAVARAGFPVEVDVVAASAEEPIASYRVRRIRVRPATDADRGAEPEYLDLRSKKAPERWREPGPGRAEVEGRELDDLRPPDPPIALPMIRRDDENGGRDGGDRDPPDRPGRPAGGAPGSSVTTLTTTSAQVALRIEQRLLDDVQRTVNSLAANLTGATTSGTDLVIPWLEQVVTTARGLDPGGTLTVPGTGLATLLHEDPGGMTPVKSVVVMGGGRGVLDRMAVSRTTALLAAGTIPAVSLSAADVAAVTTAIATAAPAARLGSLTAAVRSRLLAAVLFDDIGTVRVSLAELRKPINVSDLYFVQLTDFRFSVSLPAVPAPPTTGPAPPREAPLVTSLRCRAGGSIDGSVAIDALAVDATLVRTPTATWALLVAGSPLIPVILPMFAWVVPFLWAIAIFLATDFARARIEANPLRVVLNVGFQPSQSSPALQPVVSARLSGSIRTRMLSYVPTGIHQVIDWTLAELTNTFSVTLAILEWQIAAQLQSALRDLMGDGVPGSLLRLGVPVASGQAAGEDDKYVYLESTLGTPSDPAIRVTPVSVSAALRWDLDRDITRVFGAGGNAGRGRHYLSVGASINAINQVAAVLWRRGAFNQFVSASSAAALRPLLAPPFAGSVTRIDVFHGAPPVLSLPVGGPTDPKRFFDIVFPALVVSVNRNAPTRWLFGFQVTGRGAFGLGTVPQGKNFLALPGIQPTVYELLLDLGSISATLLEATQLEERTITVRESGNDPRRPEKITTHTEIVETTTDRTAGAPPQWLAYAVGIFRLANWWRDVNFIPRLDGIGGTGMWTLDAPSQQTYTLTGDDPDASTPAGPGPVEPYASTPLDWGFTHGLTFAHAQLDGAPRQLLSGNPHLNELQGSDAVFVWPFLNRLFP